MISQELYNEIQAHALEHYEDGGWDVVVECVDGVEEMTELFEGQDPLPSTLDEALNHPVLKACISVWSDRQADARNSVF